MSGSSNDATGKGKENRAEARAEALRANLRKRKQRQKDIKGDAAKKERQGTDPGQD